MTYRSAFEELEPNATHREPMRVVTPPEHQGVMNALRTAYPTERIGLPSDMMRLLERLG